MTAFVRIVATLVIASSSAFANAYGQIYGIVSDTSELYKISEVDGAAQLVGDAGEIFLAGLDFRPSDGFLYGFNAIDLIRIDPHDATAVVVGPHGLSGLTEGGFVITPDDIAYGLNKSSASIGTDLFSINLDTGHATVVASLSATGQDINGLAWRNDGKLVGLDGTQNALIEIDPLTAHNTVISLLAPSLGAIGGLAGDGRRGFFTTSSHVLGGTNEIYSVDFFTGEHLLIGPLGPTFEANDGISGLAFVPEPSFLGLAVAAIFAGFIVARIRT
jgi:uncharacterized protein DUF6923